MGPMGPTEGGRWVDGRQINLPNIKNVNLRPKGHHGTHGAQAGGRPAGRAANGGRMPGGGRDFDLQLGSLKGTKLIHQTDAINRKQPCI